MINRCPIYCDALQISFPYDTSALPDLSLVKVFHLQNGVWVDVTEKVENGLVYALVNSLSPFVIVEAPTVTSPSPASGPTAGGTAVTITGTNLAGATTVNFGSIPATAVLVNQAGTEITCQAPAHSAGTVDVTVTTSAGTSAMTAADGYTYAKTTPTISVNPTASAITLGQALSASTLTGGTGSVPGTFAFTSPTTVPTAVGTYSASVTFTPTDTTNYTTVTGNVNVTVNAAKVAIGGASIAAIANQAYTGSAVKPALVVTYSGKTLVVGTDYNVSYSNNTNVGTAKVTITGMGSYIGAKQATFKIHPASISDASVAAIESQTYNGSAIKPALALQFNGKSLSACTDYTASYSSNVSCGAATVKITGKGNFTGTITATFIIIPDKVGAPKAAAGCAGGAVLFSWARSCGGVTGYEVQYSSSATGTFTSAGFTSRTSLSVGNLVSGHTYYFEVRAYVTVGGVNYYGAWSYIASAKAK